MATEGDAFMVDGSYGNEAGSAAPEPAGGRSEEPGAALRGGGRIVVGVDGSSTSRQALAWAVEEAGYRHASLDAVAAWQVPVDFAMLPAGEGIGDAAVQMETDVKAELADALSEVEGSGLTITETVVEGPAAPVLIERSKGAEMLVVGSRGRGGFVGLLLGSVSSQCVHHAHCPVVVVHGEED
ncbi:MAG: universal stress protein [Acidimicrobiales bacterium]